MIDLKTGSIILGARGSLWKIDTERWGVPVILPRQSFYDLLIRRIRPHPPNL